MAKKKTTKKKTTTKKTSKKKTSRRSGPTATTAAGKHLVIVESPAKAKTINKYLGADYVVEASVGHVRDLPSKAPKGTKMPVPGVDLENDFAPSYEVLPDKKKTVSALKKLAKSADEVWFATDLDREGEAIAWHLAQELGVETERAKRVVFNAITKAEIARAFEQPHTIDSDKVNAQQARRILDRIVGYQVSPLLWKKVARGLSAGRVQSVAVRLVVDREREIMAFVPDEYWKVSARLAIDPTKAGPLGDAWRTFMAERDERDKAPTLKRQNAWMAEHGGLKADLVEWKGKKFDLRRTADDGPLDVSVRELADAIGLTDIDLVVEDDPRGRGPAARKVSVAGSIDPAARYRIDSIETKKTSSRPSAPFITSTLQMAASSAIGFGAQRTMRNAQRLYEGVEVPGEGQVGLITYMRTDSTRLSGEALTMARDFIDKEFGGSYLPEKPNFFGSSNKDAQEAHEAIRPTDVNRHPDIIDRAARIDQDQKKLYRLIWNRYVASQMMPAQWNATAVRFVRDDRDTAVVLRTTGRVLAFDGFYRVSGVPTSSDEQTLPDVSEGDISAPFSLEPQQAFTSPPPRFTEASLVKKLEEEGIGRPSTYASIIQVVQDRKYVEQLERRFHATDLGMVVTDKLMEAFPRLMDVGYTRQMESELDRVADHEVDWVDMLKDFYGRFSVALETAHENLTHAKAELIPAPYACPDCGRRTCYRFGKNGRFLSCSGYPDCSFAAPIDREGRPMMAERVDVVSPDDGEQMELRTGRFGKFISSVNYPDSKFVFNLDKKGGIKYPAQPPVETDLLCSKCESPLNVRRGKRGPWLGCSKFPKCRGRGKWAELEDEKKADLEKQLDAMDRANPPIIPKRKDGSVIPEGAMVAEMVIPGETIELDIHPEAVAEAESEGGAAKTPAGTAA